MKTTTPYATDIRLLQEELDRIESTPKLSHTETLVVKAINLLLEDYVADLEYFEDSYYEELEIAKELEYDIDYDYALGQQFNNDTDFGKLLFGEYQSPREEILQDEDIMYFYTYGMEDIQPHEDDIESGDLLLGSLELVSSTQLLWYIKNTVFCQTDTTLLSSDGTVVQLRYNDKRLMEILGELVIFS